MFSEVQYHLAIWQLPAQVGQECIVLLNSMYTTRNQQKMLEANRSAGLFPVWRSASNRRNIWRFANSTGSEQVSNDETPNVKRVMLPNQPVILLPLTHLNVCGRNPPPAFVFSLFDVDNSTHQDDYATRRPTQEHPRQHNTQPVEWPYRVNCWF